MAATCNKDLGAISYNQRQRLAYIDYCLHFIGRVSRQKIQDTFNVKGAAATRDLRLYKFHFSSNIDYDTVSKQYFIAEAFASDFSLEPETVLRYLKDDTAVFSVDSPDATTVINMDQQHKPDLAVLGPITRAMASKKRVTIDYTSLSSGLSERTIAPLALVNTGVRWHLRAFDLSHDAFIDFVINRISRAVETDDAVPAAQQLNHDKQWNRFVTITLAPHPKLSHPEAIELEYKMSDGQLTLDVRAALLGYFLRFWHVDCSKERSLAVPDSYLYLQNLETLYGVENLAIAPGFTA